jgi:catechol 2,3-dioxygenase-like lactoylglutathione lyase family enzyme
MPSVCLFQISIIVDDYDKAIGFYRDIMGFTLIEDTNISDDKRWVVLNSGENGTQILLAKASGPRQIAAIGNQFGGRVGLFLRTNDFDAIYQKLKSNNVKFHEEPRDEKYGKVVVFEDIYGNKWDLIEPK